MGGDGAADKRYKKWGINGCITCVTMKKINRISIAGLSFTFNQDAYEALSAYLNILHEAYDGNPDGNEIIADIEARVADLILSEQVCSKVVDKVLINRIITQLGMPESDSEDGFRPNLTDNTAEYLMPRRLYRLKEGAKAGGVFSGMSWFWNIDVVWLRLGFFVPIILALLCLICGVDYGMGPVFVLVSGVVILLYILMWFVIPVAKTPRQKLEMRGERITASSIRQNFQSTAQSPSARKASSIMAEVLYIVGRIAIFVFKFLGAAFGLAACLGGAAAIALSISLFIMFGWSYVSVAFALMAMLAIIPLTVLCYVLFSFAFDWKINGKSILAAVFAWFVFLIMSICISVMWVPRIARDFNSFENRLEQLLDADSVYEFMGILQQSAQINLKYGAVKTTNITVVDSTKNLDFRVIEINDADNEMSK